MKKIAAREPRRDIPRVCRECEKVFNFWGTPKDIAKNKGLYCSASCRSSAAGKITQSRYIPDFMNDLQRFWSFVDKRAPDECWPWLGASRKKGYGGFSIFGSTIGAHAFSFAIHHTAKINKGQYVCHFCDNRNCVNPAHLWLGSLQENHRDMVQKGRHPHGPTHGQWKGGNPRPDVINEDVVRRVRLDQRKQAIIAAELGVLPSLISLIKSRKVWSHVE